VRSKVSTFGGSGGPTEVTSGGNALKFYASIRLNIKRIGLVKKGEETVGSQVLVKIVKNKHAPPFKTAQFELEFGKGICRDSKIIDLGLKQNFITKVGGAFYNFNGQSFRGKDAIKRYFAENEGVRDEVMTKLKEKLMQNDTEKRSMIREVKQRRMFLKRLLLSIQRTRKLLLQLRHDIAHQMSHSVVQR
ncbi:DNA repair protein recA, mitochondrial, partial [Ananas comosus]